MKTGCLRVVLCMVSPAAVAASSDDLDTLWAMSLEEVLEVRVATGTAKPPAEAPGLVSVVTAEDIALTGALTLSEALEQVPGLHVMPSLNRLTPMYAVRGVFTENTPQVLVLLDGVELSELSALSVPYGFDYPVNAIERIEVIRGPGSAVHGADAFSGVINIITRPPADDSSLEVGVRGGAFDYREVWANASAAFDDIRLGLSATREEQGNDDERITPYGVMSRDRELDNLHLNLELGGFSLKNWYWRSEQKMGVGAGIFGNDFDRDVSEVWRSSLSWQGALADDLEASAQFSYGESKYDAAFQLLPPGVWPVGADGNVFLPPFTPVAFPDGVIGKPAGTTRRTRMDASLVYSGIEGHRIRLGLGYEDTALTEVEEYKNFGPGILDTETIPANAVSLEIVDVSNTPFAYSPSYDRELHYLSLQNEFSVTEDLELTAGLRLDDYSDFGSTLNPRLALVWRVDERLTTKFLYGSAFRAPKVAELAFVNNPTTLGNPGLDPEEMRTLELAVDYRYSDTLQLSANAFRYQAEQLIQLDQTFVFQNLGEQEGRGVELELRWQPFERMSVKTNWSYLSTKLPPQASGSGSDPHRDLDRKKERVPNLMGFLDLRYQLSDSLVLTTQTTWIADREREPADARPSVDDYVQTGVNLLWQSDAHWSATVSVKNLFNDNIVEPVGDSPLFGLGLGFPDDYPMQSRRFVATLAYEF